MQSPEEELCEGWPVRKLYQLRQVCKSHDSTARAPKADVLADELQSRSAAKRQCKFIVANMPVMQNWLRSTFQAATTTQSVSGAWTQFDTL